MLSLSQNYLIIVIVVIVGSSSRRGGSNSDSSSNSGSGPLCNTQLQSVSHIQKIR